MAAIVAADIGSEADRQVALQAVGDHPLGIVEVARIVGIADQAAGTVVVVVGRNLALDPDARKVGVHDEVDHAGKGVGSVNRRSAAGKHVDPLDDRGRNEVQVGDGRGRIARNQSATVDENQRTRRAEATKADGGDAGCTVGIGRTLVGEHLRQGVEEILDPARSLNFHFACADDRDRARRGQVRLRNARTGDDDFIATAGIGLIGAGGRRVGRDRAFDGRRGLLAIIASRILRLPCGLGKSGRSERCNSDEQSRSEQALA